MKAILGSRIIIDQKSSDHADAMQYALTYRLEDDFRTKVAGRPVYEIIKNYVKMGKGVFSIPIGRIELIPEGHEIIDNRVKVEAKFPTPKFELREKQKEVYDKVVDNCIINAKPSWGKTFTAIWIAAKLGQKTLVITHTTAIRDMWIKEVEKLLGIKSGVIGSGKFQNLDAPITITNIQTFVKHIGTYANMFGTVILDEMHHVPATTFSTILDQLPSRYKIGLSGTLIRKDKKHVLFKDFFGSTIFQPEEENSMQPKVVLVPTEIRTPPAAHWAQRVTELSLSEDYKELIVRLANTMADKGHKVLVVGERVDFLESCARRSGDRAIVITGRINNFEERSALIDKLHNNEVDILYGTRSIFSEGVSINSLSCLVLAAHINNESNLTQLIGRIQRLDEGKLQPVVIDPQLKDTTSKKQAKERQNYYVKMNYKVYLLSKF